MCDDRLETCSTCQEESCVCSEVCDKCKGWSAQCSCPTEPVLAYWCNDCQEAVEADLEVNGEQDVFPICGICKSDNVVRVDGVTDAAEYSKGDR